MVDLDVGWEVIYVDDGSRDNGPRILARLADLDSRVQVVRFDRNYGQSTAIIAGAEATFGDWIATLDANGQNDSKDIPGMWEVISMRSCDGVTGVYGRRAEGLLKQVAIWIAIGVRKQLLGQEIVVRGGGSADGPQATSAQNPLSDQGASAARLGVWL